MITKFTELLGITPSQIIEKNNKPEIAEVRFLYAKLRYEKHKLTYTAIGNEIKRSPATIMHAVNRANDLLGINDERVVEKWHVVRGLRE